VTGPVRVLFVVPDLEVGGAERHLLALAQRLDPARFQPSVVCIGQEGRLFDDLIRARVPARALHLDGRRNALRALARLVAIMRSSRPDLVVARAYNAELLGRLAARLAGVRHSAVWVHQSQDLRPRGRVRVLSDRLLDRWTDAYLGVTSAQTDYLTRVLGHPAGKVRIVENGVDPAAFRVDDDPAMRHELGLDPDDPVVAIVARLRPEKDHRTFLAAARLVSARLPRTTFLVVGDGPEAGALEQLRDDLGLADRVRFLGDHRDVDRVMRAANVVALSSVHEASPMVVLEAMACGRPVVSTDVGGVSQQVSDGVTGFLVPAGDPSALADRLVDVLSDRAAARRLGRTGRQRVEDELTLEQMVSRTQQVFAEIVGEPRSRRRVP
jgi:glycosyltransferase involved in cell wall biosynthesis